MLCRPFPKVEGCSKLSGFKENECIIHPHYNEWINFQFKHDHDMDNVLVDGPYFVFWEKFTVANNAEGIQV